MTDPTHHPLPPELIEYLKPIIVEMRRRKQLAADQFDRDLAGLRAWDRWYLGWIITGAAAFGLLIAILYCWRA